MNFKNRRCCLLVTLFSLRAFAGELYSQQKNLYKALQKNIGTKEWIENVRSLQKASFYLDEHSVAKEPELVFDICDDEKAHNCKIVARFCDGNAKDALTLLELDYSFEHKRVNAKSITFPLSAYVIGDSFFFSSDGEECEYQRDLREIDGEGLVTYQSVEPNLKPCKLSILNNGKEKLNTAKYCDRQKIPSDYIEVTKGEIRPLEAYKIIYTGEDEPAGVVLLPAPEWLKIKISTHISAKTADGIYKKSNEDLWAVYANDILDHNQKLDLISFASDKVYISFYPDLDGKKEKDVIDILFSSLECYPYINGIVFDKKFKNFLKKNKEWIVQKIFANPQIEYLEIYEKKIAEDIKTIAEKNIEARRIVVVQME